MIKCFVLVIMIIAIILFMMMMMMIFVGSFFKVNRRAFLLFYLEWKDNKNIEYLVVIYGDLIVSLSLSLILVIFKFRKSRKSVT